MFEKLKKPALMLALSCTFSLPVYADLASDLANICAIVKADDKGQLRKKISKVQKAYNVRLQDYYNGISCGGKSLLRSAILNNAVETGTLLVKRMPKSDLKAPEKDGKTLQAWVQEQGLNSSPIATALQERI